MSDPSSDAASKKPSKEYGKLTSDQFRTLINHLPELRNQRNEVGRLLATAPQEKLDSILVGGFSWGSLYECSFAEHIALAAVAFNLGPTLSRAVSSADPQQYLLDNIFQADESTHPAFSEQGLLGLVISVQRTILSVMLFQRSMSGLVQDVREDGNLDSFFNAIRVDRTVMSCSTFSDRIARAELSGDKRFFLRLRNALKGPTQKHWMAYCDLRYSLFVLRELGFDTMSDAELEQLLVHTLKVYPNTPGARKNLRKQYQHSRKLPTT